EAAWNRAGGREAGGEPKEPGGATTAAGGRQRGRPGLPPGGPECTPPAARGDGLPTVRGYEVLGELGRGGMGVGYRARHLVLHRLVALKMILSGEHAGPEQLALFRAEAEVVAQLQHPHIVQVYEVAQHGRLAYLALEYVDGGSLAHRLRGTPLPP